MISLWRPKSFGSSSELTSETSHKWRVVHQVFPFEFENCTLMFVGKPKDVGGGIAIRAKVEQKGRVFFLLYPTKSHLTNNITTQTRPPLMLKSNLTNPGSIQLHFSHPTTTTTSHTHAPMHRPMHRPMHGPVCLSTKSPIPPHCHHTVWHYIILLLVAY